MITDILLTGLIGGVLETTFGSITTCIRLKREDKQ